MNEITQEGPRQDVAVNTSPVPSLMELLGRYLINPDIPAERIELVLRHVRELSAEKAQHNYSRAMAAVQAEMQPIIRNARNDQTKSDFATLAAIDEAIRPIYTKRGFSLEFSTETPVSGSGVRVVCECSHSLRADEPDGNVLIGHTKRYSLEADLDTKGAQGNVNKTPMHGLGSTLSYLRRYLTCMIFNVALTDDDDGNAGGGRGRRGPRSDTPPPPPPRKLKDVLADLFIRMSEAPDRAAIEAIIAEPEVQRLRANVTKEPGASALAEVLAKGRARFPVPKDSEVPAFSAFVIDAFGGIVSEEIRDPIRFAHAVVDAWRNAPDPTLANTVIEHNADAIADARAYGPAALVLLDLQPRETAERTEAHATRDEPPYQPAVIEPPIERGKPFWPGWVASFKRALEDVPFANLAAWVQAQREVIVRAPGAQRLLVVRAIDAAFAPHDTPAWVADLLQAAPPTNGSTPPPTNGGQTQAVSGVSAEADEHWVEETISTLKLIETRAAFDRLCSDNGTRNRMGRLRRERPMLFEKADAAFGTTHRRLPAENQP